MRLKLTLEQSRSGHTANLILLLVLVLVGFTIKTFAQETNLRSTLEQKAAAIFERSCNLAGCHTPPTPQMGMDLSKAHYYASTVGMTSMENPSLKRIEPGEPELSYLVKKIKGEPGIVGVRMPFNKNPLSEDEINAIISWIESISEVDQSRLISNEPETVFPFLGFKNINLPTARVLDKNTGIFLIAHRFNPTLSDGFDAFYGLDGSSIIMLTLGYGITDQWQVTLGRTNSADNIELQTKYQFLQQKSGKSPPVSLAAVASLNWVAEKPNDPSLNRLRSEALKFTIQTTATMQVVDKLSLLVVPGITFNPDISNSNEDPYITIGLGGRWNFHNRMSWIAEWVPVISGFERSFNFGNENRFDSWGTGFEIATGGHVFQIILSNSVGLSTDQYILGGDQDPADFFNGDIRLGFNISRVLNFKKEQP